MQIKANEKLLSSILAHVAALEKENKNLKNEAIIKERAGTLKEINKNTQKDVEMCILFQKISKKCQFSIEPSSSEQESEDTEDIEVYFEYNSCL